MFDVTILSRLVFTNFFDYYSAAYKWHWYLNVLVWTYDEDKLKKNSCTFYLHSPVARGP